MAIFNYIKVEPTTYLAEYRRGSLKREGSGLSFWNFSPTTLVAIPLETAELPFIFNRLVKNDFVERKGREIDQKLNEICSKQRKIALFKYEKA